MLEQQFRAAVLRLTVVLQSRSPKAPPSQPSAQPRLLVQHSLGSPAAFSP